MNKLLTSVGLAIGIATASMLAGCNLYFGNQHGDHSDNNSGGSSSGSSGTSIPGGPGFGCKDNTQCSAGCFCADDGTCTEAGFCGGDTDCGDGFHCDVARSSCEPDAPPAAGCKANTDCTQGSVCDAKSGSCAATCKCTSDADAVKQGAGFCDEARQTCMTGIDPNGACNGAVTCTMAKPTCAEGQVATVTNGLPAALPLYPTQMVGFGKVLTTTQIQDVATFLAKYSGGYKTCTECAGITPTGFPSS